MKIIFTLAMLIVFMAGCNVKNNTDAADHVLPIKGTWQLISGTTIEKADTSITWYTKNLSFIKIINETHFAFLKHDLNKGKDSATASFGSGGGSYSLKDSLYTEHLEYCDARAWEGNDFTFTVSIYNDTL